MRIGIVVPAFNAAPWIGDAIASVIAQTHRDWTLVVVDDGSVDTTVNVVARFDDPRIRVIRQANAGVSAARNRGIAALSGRNDALLLLDADDWLAHDALSRLANSLAASPGAVAAVGAYAFVDTGRWRRPPAGDVLERLLVRNLFANGGHLLLRTTAVLAAGGFLTGLTYGEDWEVLDPYRAAGCICRDADGETGTVRAAASWRCVSPPGVRSIRIRPLHGRDIRQSRVAVAFRR